MIISSWATAEKFANAREQGGYTKQAKDTRRSFARNMNGRYRVFYDRFVEYGHKGPDGSNATTPPHSFGQAGFDAAADAAAQAIENAIEFGVNNAQMSFRF